MLTLANLAKLRATGLDVTVVQPSEYHYYSGMGPGVLSGIYTPEQVRFDTNKTVEDQGCTFILDKAEVIQPDRKAVRLRSGRSVQYDILSCNVGSFVPEDIVSPGTKDVFPVKPIENLMHARRRIEERATEKTVSVAVVGGGAAAFEIAANVRRLLHDHRRHPVELSVFTGRELLPGYPHAVQKKCRQTLHNLSINLNEHAYVRKAETGRLTLSNDAIYEPDITLLATGVKPSRLFVDSNIQTGPDGGMLVNKNLASVEHKGVFGGGDCIYFQPQPLDKVGVHAVKQNPVLFHNLHAQADGTDLQRFEPKNTYMLIFNTGDGRGIFIRNGIVLQNRWAFRLKDHIDRRFMRRFQQFRTA